MAGLRAQLVGRARRHDAAPRDHDDGIAERRHFLHHVAREQHAAAVVPQPADDVAHRARAHHVEAVGRLVEQHVLRIVDERARQRDLGPLAVRKALRAAVGDRRSCRACRTRCCRTLVERAAGQALQLAVVLDVLARRQARIQPRDVGQHPEPRLRRPADRRPRRRRPRRMRAARPAASARRASAASSSCRRRSGRAVRSPLPSRAVKSRRRPRSPSPNRLCRFSTAIMRRRLRWPRARDRGPAGVEEERRPLQRPSDSCVIESVGAAAIDESRGSMRMPQPCR